MNFLFLTLLLVAGCSSGPIQKEYAYKGEPLEKIGNHGLLVGHAMVPVDKFPHDRKTTIIYFENIKTKQQYQYGDTQGPFFMKLPPGDYVINELWSGGGCNTSTQVKGPATQALGFRVQPGKMTDVGNILLTCFEWDARDKYARDFTQYIEDGKFQIYRPMNRAQHECGCKILRKRDSRSVLEMKRALSSN